MELRRRYGAASVCSLPLWAHGRIVGVLTCERGGEQPFDRFTVELCEAMAALVGPTLDLKRRHDRALPFKIWESVRRQIGTVIGTGHMGVKLSVLLIAALGSWFLTSAGEFRVTSKAVLEGEVQRVAAAPFQGYIRTAPARAGDVVKAGQVLATLQDRDLQLERLKRLNEREQLAKDGVDLARYFTDQGPPRLTLITCGGAFDDGSGHYLDNIIITAVPA